MRCSALLTASVVLVACGGGGGAAGTSERVGASTVASTATTAAPTTESPTTTTLSDFETQALAAELVPVPGFEYGDVSDEERTRSLAGLSSSVAAASFHTVLDATTGDEIGFLAFFVIPPDDAALAPGNAEAFAAGLLGSNDVTRAEYSGREVYWTEDPDRPMSRFMYTWSRHGTVAWFDGADRDVLEAFLAGYFAQPFVGIEDPILAERMMDVPGYGYSNAIDRTAEADAVALVAPGATAVLHYLFDQTHEFAGLVLAGPIEVTGVDELATLVHDWLVEAYGMSPSATADNVGTTTIHGVEVLHLRLANEEMDLYLFYWPSTQVAGWVMTTRPDITEQFLTAYLALQPSG